MAGGKAVFLWRWDNLYIWDVYHLAMKREGFEEHAGLRVAHRATRLLHLPLHLLAAAQIGLLLGALRRRSVQQRDLVPLALLLICLSQVALAVAFMPVPRYATPLRP